MARGWESKSVESQMEERREAKPHAGDQAAQDRLERARKREGIESSRRGVMRELEATKSDLRRRSLEAALKHLDDELSKLN
jgi:hypothetical protein